MNNISDSDHQSKAAQFYNEQGATVAMLIIFSVIGVFGNAIILIVYGRLVKLTTTQFLIFVIAIFDFLTALVVTPLAIIYKMFWFDIASIYYCRIIFSAVQLSVIPGAVLLFVVTIVRYCHVCQPQLLCYIEPRVKQICIASLVIAIFYSLIAAIFSTISNETGHCIVPNTNIVLKHTFASRLYLVMAVMVVLIALNILIIIKTCQNKLADSKRREMKLKLSNAHTENEDKLDTNSLSTFFELVKEIQSKTKLTDGQESKSLKSQSYKDDGISSYKSQTLSGNNTQSVRSESDPVTITSLVSKVSGSNVDKTDTSMRSTPTANKSDQDNVRGDKKRGRSFIFSDESLKALSSTTTMISVVSLVYMLAFIPSVVWEEEYGDYFTPRYNAQTIKYLLVPLYNMFYLSCAANPIIYTFINQDFRSKCRAMFGL